MKSRNQRKQTRKGIHMAAFLAIVISLLTSCANAEPANTGIVIENPPEETMVQPVVEPVENDKETEAEPTLIDYEGDLELPVTGATGYAPVSLELKESSDWDSGTIQSIAAGTAFQIVKEEGDWWLVHVGSVTGWLPHPFCFINLPDVLPSIIYDNTNTYASKYHSSGKEIPNITNQPLYEGLVRNERLARDEYIMPVLYTMSKKIHKAQQQALLAGHSLKIYEAYRPFGVQRSVANELMALAEKDPAVMEGISTPPWGLSWFIVDGVSNHQRGYAIDVSLVQVDAKIDVAIGSYRTTRITDYTEFAMPTPVHELSKQSAIFTHSVPVHSATVWKKGIPAETMNEPAFALQAYCTDAGLTPLASEWWHFNDLEAKSEVENKKSTGQFILSEVLSSPPVTEQPMP